MTENASQATTETHPAAPLPAVQAASATPAPPVRVPIPTDTEINRLYRLAQAMAQSGLFRDARQAGQAFVKILAGRELAGWGPFQSMTNLHIVDGKPELSANGLATLIKQHDGYDYEVRELNNDKCSIAFFRDDQELGVETYTREDAKRAGLDQKDNHRKYPRNLNFARCMSNGTAFFCPEVTAGIRVYVEGELPGSPYATEAPALNAVAVDPHTGEVTDPSQTPAAADEDNATGGERPEVPSDDHGYGPDVAAAVSTFMLGKPLQELDDADRGSVRGFLHDAARGELPAPTLTETIAKLARRAEQGEDVSRLRVLLNEKVHALALRVQAAREQERREPSDAAQAA